MAAISQTTFSNTFSWMQMWEFLFNFHRNLFLRVQLTINMIMMTSQYGNTFRIIGLLQGKFMVTVTLSFDICFVEILNTLVKKAIQFPLIHLMMTSSNGNIFRVTGPLCGEFTGPGEFPTQRPVTRSFDVFFDLRLNKRLSKQPRGWWFEMPSWSLWCQCNVSVNFTPHVARWHCRFGRTSYDDRHMFCIAAKPAEFNFIAVKRTRKKGRYCGKYCS